MKKILFLSTIALALLQSCMSSQNVASSAPAQRPVAEKNNAASSEKLQEQKAARQAKFKEMASKPAHAKTAVEAEISNDNITPRQ